MKIAVAGLFHLGCVTAACLAGAGFNVVAYDADEKTISDLKRGQPPIFEPGLEDLLKSGCEKNHLQYTSNISDVSAAEIIWITFDTPVDDNDIADVEFVTNEIEKLFPHLQQNALVLISAQIPVSTTRKLLQKCAAQFPEKNISFACSPENLRLGKAISVFTQPDRVIVGIENQTDKDRITKLLQPFTQNIVWMSIESAEMTKHALNAFLATSVVFINELSVLCERVGANAREVEAGLKSEERIGPKAYLRPGNAIGGGTLARDVNYLIKIGEKQKLPTPLFSSLLESNHQHKQWSCRKLMEIFQDLKNKTIAALGLTYKSGTDTLRRSTAVEMCEWLSDKGAAINAFDPALNTLPDDLSNIIQLKSSMDDALKNADAVLITTECPEFKLLNIESLIANVRNPFIFDPSGFLAGIFGQDERVRYFSVGRQA